MRRYDDEYTAYVVAARPRLYRAAYLLCGSHHQAEDLVATALAKLYTAWPRARRADAVDAYARRVLVNTHTDETRRPWRRERPSEPLVLDRPTEDTPSDEDLWHALRGLPPGQRRVVVLRHYWGLSVEETAADLGISAGTVKSQTSAALAALRRVIQPEGESR